MGIKTIFRLFLYEVEERKSREEVGVGLCDAIDTDSIATLFLKRNSGSKTTEMHYNFKLTAVVMKRR